MSGTKNRNLTVHDLLFGIISQQQLTWSEHTGRVLGVGEDAVTLEMFEQVDPGYAWFCQKIGGTRAGYLEWCRPLGDRYQARIRFVPLTWNVEQYVRERARRSLAHLPLRDPAEVLGLRPSFHAPGSSSRGTGKASS